VRMRRIRASGRVRTEIFLTCTPEGAQRRLAYAKAWPKDPILGGSRLATFKGPFNVPPESFTEEVLQTIFSLR
jgi:hypothetical protein